MVFCTWLSYAGCRTAICMSLMMSAAGYRDIKYRVLSHSIRWILAITKLCILTIITLHFTSLSISLILQQGLISHDMKPFRETNLDSGMPENKRARNWIKKYGLFHTKCLSLVFSTATYWKYFFNLDCKVRAMSAQCGFLWPKKQQQTFHLHM